MLPLTLLLMGGALSCWCLWGLRKWLKSLEDSSASAPMRIQALVDELVVTAEATVAIVAERTETLEQLLTRADCAAVTLRAGPEPRVEQIATGNPDYQAVYTLADSGEDTTQIARKLGMTKGAVELILGLRPSV